MHVCVCLCVPNCMRSRNLTNKASLGPVWADGPEKKIIFKLSAELYRVSREERTKLRESVPYVKLYRYNPKHLCPKLNSY